MYNKTNIDKTNQLNELPTDAISVDFDLAPESTFQLADPGLVNYYKDYRDRTIWIDKEIDGSLFDEIRTIIQWNNEDDADNVPVKNRKPIKIYIHSYGGDIDSCFALIDIMNISKTPIYTININCALSAGCLIFINGHKRFCLPLSQALIHSGSGSYGGTYEQVIAQTNNYRKTIEMMRKNFLAKTSVDNKTFNKWKDKEIYLYAEDQIKYGLADTILNDLSELQ